MSKAQNTVFVAAFVPPDLADRLARVAKRNDRPRSSIIRMALASYLAAEELR